MANKKSLALTKEQYENIIGAMRMGGNTFRANDRIAAALVLEANLGLRIGDILKLRLQDIVLDGARYRLDIVEEKTQEETGLYCASAYLSVSESVLYGSRDCLRGGYLPGYGARCTEVSGEGNRRTGLFQYRNTQLP